MSIPRAAYPAPFNMTRASHVVVTVKDTGASRAFYVDTLGFIVSDEDVNTLYLRGLEEVCHHSLVLKKTTEAPVCERVGMRVYTEDDLKKAKAYFENAGLPAKWVEVPHQGKRCTCPMPLAHRWRFARPCRRSRVSSSSSSISRAPIRYGSIISRSFRPTFNAPANFMREWASVYPNMSPSMERMILFLPSCNIHYLVDCKKSECTPFRHSRENGNPVFKLIIHGLDSRLRGNDEFLRDHQK